MNVSLALQSYDAPLAERARNARAEWRTRRGTVLTLSTAAGLAGRGEAAPLPGRSLDSFERDQAELRAIDLAALGRLVELGVASPPALAEQLARWEQPAAPAARFALETALLELIALRRGEPLHRLLRAVYGLAPASNASVAVAALLDPDSALPRAAELLASGFSTLKLKVGIVPRAEELTQIAELRSRHGDSFRLRLDANRAWSAVEAQARLTAFAPHHVEFIEEPTQPGQRLTAPAVAVALDESLPEAADFSENERSARGVRAWVIKPTILGGITRALSLASAASRAGLDVVVSHAFEGPVALAALSELALALGPSLAQGLGPHAALAAWQLPLPAGHRGVRLERHDELGLGLPPLRTVPGAS